MWILVNCFLLTLTALLLVFGVSFYLKNKEAADRSNYYILIYCITSAIWCCAYGLIGITDNFDYADMLRKVGVGAIEAFLVNEVFFVTGMFKEKQKTIFFLRTAMIVFAVIDFIAFSQTGINNFVTLGNWTTWTTNEAFRTARIIHSHFVVLAFFTALISGIVWAKTNTLKRQKSFITLMFIANAILMVFTIPDTVLPSMGIYAVPTSGIGAAGCALVMWLAATKLNSFDVRMGNIIEKIYDFINSGVLVFDTDKRITIANPYAKDLTDRDITGCGIDDIFDMDEKTREEIFSQSLNNTYSVNACAKDGKTYSLQMNAVLDDYGDPYCFLCIFMDISQEVELIRKLEVANNAKTRFLTSMSHEIRTPINAVMGFNEIISRESTDPEIEEYSEHIDRASRHLLSIINNLLDMEQITVGKLSINPEDYDLSEVIRDAYSINALRAANKGLDFKVKSTPEIPRFLYGDSVRLQQIIVNLTSNAVKYTRSGSVTLEVDYRLREGREMDLIIRVRDTGIGIREEDKSRLFSLFERFDVDANKRIEGTGLGLALTKRITEIMKGSIEVESEYGKGSCFTVTIPQEVMSFEYPGLDLSVVTGKEKKYRASFIAPRANVLVVDDNELNLKVAAGLMKPLQIKVDCVESGLMMLEAIKTKKYDVILLDHLMPELDGVETLNIMRSDDTHVNQDTPVIVMTANAIRGMKEELLKEGFEDFLPKPVDPAALEEMLKGYLKPELIETCREEEGTYQQPEREDDLIKALVKVDGIDVDMAFSGVTDVHMLKDIMETFCNTARKETELLDEYYEKCLPSGDDEWLKSYRIKVHAMKNSAATMGHAQLSGMAKELETAAAEKNMDLICSNHEKYVIEYRNVATQLSDVLYGGGKPETAGPDRDVLIEELDKACEAMRNFDTLYLNDYAMRLQNIEFDSEELEERYEELKAAIRDFDEGKFFKAAEDIRDIIAR